MSNHLDRISSLRRIHPNPHSDINLSGLRSLQNIGQGKIPTVNWGLNIGGMGKPTQTGPTTKFKAKAQDNRNRKRQNTPINLSKIIEESIKTNKKYWQQEIGKVIKEFGFDSLTPRLKKLAKELGLKIATENKKTSKRET